MRGSFTVEPQTGGRLMPATITITPAPVSRCTAAQEMAEALRVLQQIAARIDTGKDRAATEGNEGA